MKLSACHLLTNKIRATKAVSLYRSHQCKSLWNQKLYKGFQCKPTIFEHAWNTQKQVILFYFILLRRHTRRHHQTWPKTKTCRNEDFKGCHCICSTLLQPHCVHLLLLLVGSVPQWNKMHKTRIFPYPTWAKQNLLSSYTQKALWK